MGEIASGSEAQIKASVTRSAFNEQFGILKSYSMAPKLESATRWMLRRLPISAPCLLAVSNHQTSICSIYLGSFYDRLRASVRKATRIEGFLNHRASKVMGLERVASAPRHPLRFVAIVQAPSPEASKHSTTLVGYENTWRSLFEFEPRTLNSSVVAVFWERNLPWAEKTSCSA